jgi:hypothetical protein
LAKRRRINMSFISVLVLEDDLGTLSAILDKLSQLEDEQRISFSMIVLTDYTQVLDYINNNPKANFDIVLLDRDCKRGGSFHVLDLERFGAEKVIGISSVPEYNEQLKSRGVSSSILKNYNNLGGFAEEVMDKVCKLINRGLKMPKQS